MYGKNEIRTCLNIRVALSGMIMGMGKRPQLKATGRFRWKNITEMVL